MVSDGFQVFLARRGFEMSAERTYRRWRHALGCRCRDANRGGASPLADPVRHRRRRAIMGAHAVTFVGR